MHSVNFIAVQTDGFRISGLSFSLQLHTANMGISQDRRFPQISANDRIHTREAKEEP